MDTLSHEYVHYILTKKSRNRLPLWMHEGIAKLLETRWRDDLNYMSPIMETILSGALKNDYRVPLGDMMPSLAKLKTAKDVQLAYAEVSTMMEYLLEKKVQQPSLFYLKIWRQEKSSRKALLELQAPIYPHFKTTGKYGPKIKNSNIFLESPH